MNKDTECRIGWDRMGRIKEAEGENRQRSTYKKRISTAHRRNITPKISILSYMIFDAKSFKAVSRTLDCRFHDVPGIEHHIVTWNLLYEYVTYSTHTVLRESG